MTLGSAPVLPDDDTDVLLELCGTCNGEGFDGGLVCTACGCAGYVEHGCGQ